MARKRKKMSGLGWTAADHKHTAKSFAKKFSGYVKSTREHLAGGVCWRALESWGHANMSGGLLAANHMARSPSSRSVLHPRSLSVGQGVGNTIVKLRTQIQECYAKQSKLWKR